MATRIAWLGSLHTCRIDKHRVNLRQEAMSKHVTELLDRAHIQHNHGLESFVCGLVEVRCIDVVHGMSQLDEHQHEQVMFWQDMVDHSLMSPHPNNNTAPCLFRFHVLNCIPLPDFAPLQHHSTSNRRFFFVKLEEGHGPQLLE